MAAVAVGASLTADPFLAAAGILIVAYLCLTCAYPKLAAAVCTFGVLADETLAQVLHTHGADVSGDVLVLVLFIGIMGRSLFLNVALRPLPGLPWFGLYCGAALISSVSQGVAPGPALLDSFLLLKGILFGLAVVQLRWRAEDVDRLIRIGTVLITGALAAAAINLLAPAVWASVLTSEAGEGERFGLPVIIGPFTHPVSFGHVMALAAIAIVAHRATLGTGSRSRILLIATVLGTVFSGRRKALAGLVGGALSAQLTLRHDRARTVLIWILALTAVTVALWSTISTVLHTTSSEYLGNNPNVARTRLYRDSIGLASHHFPLGTGFGTYGGYSAAVNYSPIYTDLGYQHVYGLEPGGNFLTDTFWPAIVAESGFLGLFGYLCGLFAILRYFRRSAQTSAMAIAFLALTGVGWWVEFAIESVASPVYNSPPAFPLFFGLLGVLSALRTNADSAVIPRRAPARLKA